MNRGRLQRRRHQTLTAVRRGADPRWWCLGPLIVACVAIGGEIIADSAAEDFVQELMVSIGDGASDAVAWMLTWWLDVDTIAVSDCSDPASSACGQASGAIAHMQDNTQWIVAALAVGSVLFAVAKMALERSGKAAAQLARGMIVLVITSSLGLGIVQLGIIAGDAYSSWILERAVGDKDVQEVFGVIIVGAVESGQAASLLIALLLVALLTSLVQIVIMFGRMAGLVLISGLLPVAAAAGVSEGGRAMRDKYFAWLVALVLYKPAAATIWAAAFWTIGDISDMEGVDGLLVCGAMFIMAIFALPALMRLIVPAVSAVSGSGGGGGAGGVASAGSQLASGASQLQSQKTQTSSSSSSSGPSGAGKPPPSKPSGGPQGSTPPGGGGGGGGGGAGGASPAGGQPTPVSGPNATGAATPTASAGTASAGGKAAAGSAAGGGAAAAGAGPAGAAVIAVGKAKEVTQKVADTAADGAGGEGAH